MKHFPYYAIQCLVHVTDTEGNVTTSTYDMGDRRTEVNHPASGITRFTYDALGNVLTKQTANLAKEGKFITYDYDYQRLTGINYPDHPENNVKYYYGGRNASQNRIGRLMLREDGTGAIEYFYGKMDEVTKTRRTMIVPNQAIATYVTQWTYDSRNRLLEMIYPDEEKITYSYNLGGQLEKAAERKLKWDEENRLLASDDNGFVTNYWYDADGERTVKTSGESDQVYVNSEFAGGRTNTAKFSLYVSPYLVANQGGRYTKHIYIGSQRVVSKIGDFDSYGSDPRRIQYVGSETDGLAVDYKVKYAQQLQAIKDNYATFAMPYNGEDNNDYVDGKGFCCNDGSLEAAQARAMARAAKNNFQEGDAYEKMQFYYHPDHLGSSSYITNLDGEVVQHIEYVPFGEVFVEERNNIWNTPYLFNAKEFDEDTGLYYYGARYYDPRVSLWISVDPISNFDPRNSENYIDGQHNGGFYNSLNLFPYEYCYQNPIRLIDPNGKQVDITITDKVVGYANLRVIVSSNIKNAPQTMRVPLYQATVNDAATKKISEYAVTRDALWSTRAEGSHIFVNNSAFEPKDDVGRYQGMIVDYPSNSGLQAVLLLNSKGTNKLSTSNDRITPPTEGASKGFATSVMIHVVGEYQRSDNKTYITGSFGCFGVYKKNGDNLVGGNEAINAFIKDVQNRQNANKDKSLHVNVNQRDSVKWNEVVKIVKK